MVTALLNPLLLQSRKGRGTARILRRSDEDGSQQPDAQSEQWRQDFHIDTEEESVWKDITSLIPELASFWDGSLGKITTVKHHIYVQPNSRPAYPHPYQTELKTKDHQDQKNDQMLIQGVIRTPLSKCASPVVLA